LLLRSTHHTIVRQSKIAYNLALSTDAATTDIFTLSLHDALPISFVGLFPPAPSPRSSMATASQWVQGSRPRTWPAAVAPVAAGTGAAVWELQQAAAGTDCAIVVPRALLALEVALSMMIRFTFAYIT